MKDAKGHGSNNRGGSYPNIDRSGFRKGQHVGYANGAWRITKLGAGYMATHQTTGESFRGNSLGHVSEQLAARALAGGGAKSASAPVHDAMGPPKYEDRPLSQTWTPRNGTTWTQGPDKK